MKSLSLSPVARLSHHAETRPEALALCFLADGEAKLIAWTYAELASHVQSIAMRLRKYAGQRALLLHPPGLEFVAALFACWAAGVVAVPAPMPRFSRNNRSGERFARLVADADPEVALTTLAKLHLAETFGRSTPGLERLRWAATNEGESSDTPQFSLPPPPSPHQLAMLQYTSGSTGTPRGVMLSHGNLASNQAAIQKKFGHTQASRVVSWLPPYHDMGLIGGILQPLAVGFPCLLMDPAHFMQRPVRWLQAISRFGATSSGGPDFAYQLCVTAIDARELVGVDLSTWDLAFTGAEPVRDTTLQRFAERFAPWGFRRSAFYPCYGLAESTLLVTGGDKATEPVLRQIDSRPQVGCGSVVSGHDLRVVTPEGRSCADGVVGEIWVSGPSVAEGYWKRPEDTAASFVVLPSDADASQRFLRTGDLGCLYQGELFVMGRLKDLIIVRGRNIHPQDIEAAVSACHPVLGASVAFGIPGDEGEQLAVVAEVRREHRHSPHLERALATLHAVIGREFDLHVQQSALVNPGTLLRTTSGKVRRAACREAYLAGQWDLRANLLPEAGPISGSQALADELALAMTAATADERMVKLRSYLERRTAQVLGVPVSWLAPEATLSDLGVDSLMRMELLLQLEADLDISLGSEGVQSDTSLESLARRIHVIKEAGGSHSRSATCERALDEAPIPFTPIQVDFLRPGLIDPRKLYTIAYLRLPADTDMARLEATVRRLDAEFDALRVRFIQDGERWSQSLCAASSGVSFRRLDLKGESTANVRQAAEQLYQTMHEGFDLQRGLLAQAVWLDTGAGNRSVLAFAVHHLVADGTAMAVLLVALERAYRHGRVAVPRSSGVTYAQWGHRLSAFSRSPAVVADLAYWQQVCGPSPRAAAPPEGTANGGGEADDWTSLRRQIDPLCCKRLLERYPSSRLQHDLFLVLWARAWGRQTGQLRVLVELEDHGRHALLDGAATDAPTTTVGWLASRFPVAVPLQPDETLSTLLERVSKIVAEIPYHGLSYGLLRHVHPDPAVRGEMECLARPAIKMVYRSRLDHGFRVDARFPVFLVQHINRSRSIDRQSPGMALEIGRSNTGLNWKIAYNRRLHDEASAQALAERLEALLQDAFPHD